MTIVADGGSTKTSWRIICNDGQVISKETEGINPVYQNSDEIANIVKSGFEDSLYVKATDTVDFYGAGVLSDELSEKMRGAFKSVFPKAEMHFESDLLAAARALCGHRSGIACIVGTGSNSCFYDGNTITDNIKAGGFILGDEASGAYLGRRLVSDYIKNMMPPVIENAFSKRYKLDYATIVRKVYREANPNAFLASFAPFIKEYINQPYCNSLVKTGFEEFLTRNVMSYDYKRYPVNFVGSVAFHFKSVLEKCVAGYGMRLGKVIREPIDALVDYYVSQ